MIRFQRVKMFRYLHDIGGKPEELPGQNYLVDVVLIVMVVQYRNIEIVDQEDCFLKYKVD